MAKQSMQLRPLARWHFPTFKKCSFYFVSVCYVREGAGRHSISSNKRADTVLILNGTESMCNGEVKPIFNFSDDYYTQLNRRNIMKILTQVQVMPIIKIWFVI